MHQNGSRFGRVVVYFVFMSALAVLAAQLLLARAWAQPAGVPLSLSPSEVTQASQSVWLPLIFGAGERIITQSAVIDYSVIPEGEIPDGSSYCLPLLDEATRQPLEDKAMYVTFDWELGHPTLQVAGYSVQSFRDPGGVRFIGGMSRYLANGDCSAFFPEPYLWAAQNRVATFHEPGSGTCLHALRDDEVIASRCGSQQNVAEVLMIAPGALFDEIRLITDGMAGFDDGDSRVELVCEECE